MDVTREMLKEYRNMRYALQALDEEKRFVYDTYKSPSLSSSGAGSLSPSSPVERAQSKLQLLDMKREKLITEMTEIENHVDAVKDHRIRSILKYRYILSYSWESTAAIMKLSESVIRDNERTYFNAHDCI